MQSVRLIREVNQPLGRGPWNGQYALQKALRRRSPEWLRIGGVLLEDEIAWFWCWLDRDAAAAHAMARRPFIAGPNVLFENSFRACRIPAERQICNASSCRLLFTESAWYHDLIEKHRGTENRAPIVLWPYPIDPRPGGPLAAKYDLLIYAKGGHHADLIDRLRRRYPRSRLVIYGQYRREELFEIARRSCCCAYLSEDDRGPLALPRFCSPAVRRLEFQRERLLSSPVEPACCSIGSNRWRAWRPLHYVTPWIAVQWTPWLPSRSTRRKLSQRLLNRFNRRDPLRLILENQV
jgi:hypothetical protein